MCTFTNSIHAVELSIFFSHIFTQFTYSGDFITNFEIILLKFLEIEATDTIFVPAVSNNSSTSQESILIGIFTSFKLFASVLTKTVNICSNKINI
ncbi:hypothetical protein BpHYR1_004057 [Brachionus plicatilis]|uniref:Uncharacterized protein n=1 Tax=Brachionus plicatilis TaxID=10195 RepID=A0A3M7QYD4_BRAPC|nr:hypothetical protein BpHYR1_004057 [Brachionus plicatilis]